MGLYLALFDGLRGYYCRYPKERGAAGFSAASTLSFLFGINLMGTFIISDYLVSGNVAALDVAYHYRWSLLALGLVVFYAHVKWAKSTGRYDSKEPSHDPTWVRKLALYSVVSGGLFIGSIMCAFASRSNP
jgi:hypothetical protein